MANDLKNPSSYVTVSGLSEFLTQIKAKYADNSSSSYSVKYSDTAAKLTSAKTISFATGDVTGSFSFDGSANVSDVALSIGSGKVTNAMLAGSIEQSKISGLSDSLAAKLDDSQLVTSWSATTSDANIPSEKLVKAGLDDKVDKIEGKGLSTEDYTTADKTKVAGIAGGAQVNVLEGVKVNSTDLTIDTNKKVNVTVVEGSTNGTIAVNGEDVAVHGLAGAAYAAIVNNVTTTTAGSVLDATQGKALADRISALEGVGRFLSTWNMTTGLPGDDPATSPYAYKAGDYYIVNNVPATGDKLKPEGTSYTKGVASTAVETGTVALGDFYFYTKTGWQLVHYDAREVTFSQIAGDARDNSSIAGHLDGKLSATATVNGNEFSDNAAVTIDGGDILATGYAKASAKSAIAATDNLNVSLGKLEYKVDNIIGSEVTLTGYTKATEAAAIADTDKVDAALGKLEYKVDGTATDLADHTGNGDIHVSTKDKEDWNAKYDKPTGGIPKTDFNTSVQTSLGKADSAVQSVTAGSANGTIAVDGTDVSVTGLGTAAYKADTYFVAAESGKRLMTDAEGTKLAGIAEGAQVNVIEGIKLSDSSSVITPSSKIVTIPNATTSADGLMSSEDKTKIDGMQAGATKVEASLTNGNIKINGTETTVYTHPAYTAKAADLYVMTVNDTGHVSAATAAAYSDLPITKSDLDGTIGVASASANGLMSSTHYSKLEGLVAATNDDIDSIFA